MRVQIHSEVNKGVSPRTTASFTRTESDEQDLTKRLEKAWDNPSISVASRLPHSLRRRCPGDGAFSPWPTAIFPIIYLDWRQTTRFQCGTIGLTPLTAGRFPLTVPSPDIFALRPFRTHVLRQQLGLLHVVDAVISSNFFLLSKFASEVSVGFTPFPIPKVIVV